MKKVLVSFVAFFAIFMPYVDLQLPSPVAAEAKGSSDPVIERFEEQESAPNPNQIFALVNAERMNAGLPELKPSRILAEVAELRAADMQRNSYYAHESPEGLYYYDLLTGSDYGNNYSCENLDLRFDTNAGRYVSDWLNSPAHKKCLLSTDSSRAGYAAIKVAPTAQSEDIPAYIVVAIHAAE